jgi:uncharacterized membrane protein
MNSADALTDKIIATGRIFFAFGLMGIGLQHFYFKQFIPVVVPCWSAWIPGRLVWVFLVGAVLLVAGGMILAGKLARFAATIVGGIFLLSVLLLHIPDNVIRGVVHIGAWTGAFKALAFSGSAFVVAGTLPDGAGESGHRPSSLFGPLEKLIPLGMYPLAIMVTVFGADHFLYVPFVSSLVPAWIPWHVFWTYFAGAALIASGLGMIFRVKARLAATLLGAMIFTWVIVLHIPRAIADPYGAIGNEWTSVFEALAFSGIAFILGRILPRRAEF